MSARRGGWWVALGASVLLAPVSARAQTVLPTIEIVPANDVPIRSPSTPVATTTQADAMRRDADRLYAAGSFVGAYRVARDCVLAAAARGDATTATYCEYVAHAARTDARAVVGHPPGDHIPPGLHVVERPRRGLLIAGPITFGSAYLVSVLMAALTVHYSASGVCDACALVPGLAIVPAFQGFASSSAIGTSNSVFYLLSGLAQLGGIGLFIGAFTTPQRALAAPPDLERAWGERDLEWSIVPSAPGTLAGASFVLTAM